MWRVSSACGTVTLTKGWQVAASKTEVGAVEDGAEHLDNVASDHGGSTELLDNTEQQIRLDRLERCIIGKIKLFRGAFYSI